MFCFTPSKCIMNKHLIIHKPALIYMFFLNRRTRAGQKNHRAAGGMFNFGHAFNVKKSLLSLNTIQYLIFIKKNIYIYTHTHTYILIQIYTNILIKVNQLVL